MSVTPQIRVNGGAPQTEYVEASVGDVIQMTAASYATWGSPVARWWLYDFPSTYALPAGWSLDATSGAYYYDSNGDPPPFTCTEWGRFVVDVYATENSVGVGPVRVLIDVPSPAGLRDLGRGEGALYGGARKRWVATVQDNNRLIEPVIHVSTVVAAGSLEVPLVFVGRRRYTVPPASGTYALPPPATAGHVEDAVVEWYIPAGNATGLATLPPVYNISGDAFDAARPHLIEVQRVAGGFKGVATSLTVTEAVVPTLSTVSTSVGSTSLTLVFSEAVYVNPAALASITLAFSAGTARTVSAIASGNNTNTIVLTLSGDISAASIATLSIAASTVYDLQGNALATVSARSVAINYQLPGIVHDWDMASAVDSGSGTVASVPDAVGSCTLAQATAGNRPNLVTADALAKNQACADFDGSDDWLEGTRASFDASEYTLMVVARVETLGNAAFLNGAPSAGGGPDDILLMREGTDLKFRGGSSGNQANAAWGVTDVVCIICRHRGADRDIYINGVLLDSTTAADNPNAIAYWSMGRLTNGAFYHLNGRIYRAQVAHTYVSAQDIADASAWAAAKYIP